MKIIMTTSHQYAEKIGMLFNFASIPIFILSMAKHETFLSKNWLKGLQFEYLDIFWITIGFLWTCMIKWIISKVFLKALRNKIVIKDVKQTKGQLQNMSETLL